jgi:hypothetical protein
VWTDANGVVTIGVPPNINGLGYVCYSRTGYGQPFSIQTRATTQVFEGAVDLDIGPATNGGPTLVGRVWCGAGTNVQAILTADTTGWDANATVTIDVLDPSGDALATAQQGAGAASATANGVGVSADGWASLQLRGVGLPDGGSPFTIAVTYTATQALN